MNRDILSLEANPRPHGVERLETKEKLYSFYVGPLVVKVGDRKIVYRRVK